MLELPRLPREGELPGAAAGRAARRQTPRPSSRSSVAERRRPRSSPGMEAPLRAGRRNAPGAREGLRAAPCHGRSRAHSRRRPLHPRSTAASQSPSSKVCTEARLSTPHSRAPMAARLHAGTAIPISDPTGLQTVGVSLPTGFRLRPARNEDAPAVAAFANEETSVVIGVRVVSRSAVATPLDGADGRPRAGRRRG